MSAANESQPMAQGDLARTPFAHLVLYLHREGLSGTLVIERGGFETKILFRNGRAVAARPLPRGAGLQEGLLELCALAEGGYGFWENDLVGEGAAVTRGTVDPFTFVTESLRGHVRDQVVTAIVERYRGVRVILHPAADLRRLGLRGIEARVAELLRTRPRVTEDFVEHSELAPSEARKLLYLLLVTKQVLPEGADTSGSSGVRSAIDSVPPMAGARAGEPSRRPDETRASSVRPTQPAPSTSDAPGRASTSPGSRSAPPAAERGSQPASLPAWQQLAASLRPGASTPPGAARSRPPSNPAARIPSMAPPPVETLDDAGKLRRAEQLAERRNYAEAMRILDDLVACDARNPDYLAMRAWVLYQQFTGTRPPRPLLDAIESALRMNEEHPRALYVKGLIFKRIGKANEALRYFQRALDADPHHIDAQREVRLARMRRDR